MAGLFDFLEAINSGKALQLDDANPYKEYLPFQINNGLSQHLDTVMIANEMNKRPWLSKEMQFKFFDNSVSKRKRFGKWAKVEEAGNAEDIDLVVEYYQVSKSRAGEYLKLLQPGQLEALRKATFKGGDTRKTKAKKG